MARIKVGYIVFTGTLLLLGGCSDSATGKKTAQELTTAEVPGSRWEGQMIRRPGSTPADGKVFLVKEGKRHWVVSADWFKQHGYNFPADVRVIPAEDLARIPEGDVLQTAVSKWQGQLVRRPGSDLEDGKVYLIEGGQKRWVESGEWLKLHNYNIVKDVKVIPAKDLAEIPLGQDLR